MMMMMMMMMMMDDDDDDDDDDDNDDDDCNQVTTGDGCFHLSVCCGHFVLQVASGAAGSVWKASYVLLPRSFNGDERITYQPNNQKMGPTK